MEHVHAIMSSSLLATVISICPSSVDCFFIITDVLTSISLMNLAPKQLSSPAFWLQFLTLRYMRIVPFHLLMHLTFQLVSKFAGSEPFRDYGTSHTCWSYICQNDTIWSIIFPSTNLITPLDHCNPVGWYLASDIQFSLLTPFITVLYVKRPIVAHISIVIASLAAMANHIWYYYNLPQGRGGGLEFSGLTLNYITADGVQGYTNPQYRCMAYFIGLASGQLLHQYKHAQIKQWPRCFVAACKILFWSTLSILCDGPYLVPMLPLNNLPVVHLLGSIVGGTIHGLVSLGISALVID